MNKQTQKTQLCYIKKRRSTLLSLLKRKNKNQINKSNNKLSSLVVTVVLDYIKNMEGFDGGDQILRKFQTMRLYQKAYKQNCLIALI